jgi:hypothetical protein
MVKTKTLETVLHETVKREEELLLLRWFGEGVGVNGIYIETQREEGKRGS